MGIEIRRTTITPGEVTDAVVLHISDAPPDAEDATFDLTLFVEVPSTPGMSLRRMQREALKVASGELRRIISEME